MPGPGSMAYPKSAQVGQSRAERKQQARAQEAAEMKLCYAIVNDRDDYKCRVCQKAGNPHALGMLERLHHHHLIFRSRGGAHVPEGVILICRRCHDLIHVDGSLRITGDANERDERGRLNGLVIERLSESGWAVDRTG